MLFAVVSWPAKMSTNALPRISESERGASLLEDFSSEWDT